MGYRRGINLVADTILMLFYPVLFGFFVYLFVDEYYHQGEDNSQWVEFSEDEDDDSHSEDDSEDEDDSGDDSPGENQCHCFYWHTEDNSQDADDSHSESNAQDEADSHSEDNSHGEED